MAALAKYKLVSGTRIAESLQCETLLALEQETWKSAQSRDRGKKD